jgi:hypothetical protein
MDFFSFNYKPKDFKKGDQDKSLVEILEMKPSKIGKDFFTKYEKEIVEAGLREETLSAIQLLSDLRDKARIYDKCYKPGMKESTHHQSHKKVHHYTPPVSSQQMQMQPPAIAPNLENEAAPAPAPQSGGRRRKSIKRKSKSKRTKRKRTKRKSTKRKSIKRKSKRTKRIYKGGEFKGLNTVLNESNPSPPLISYEAPINTSA